MSSTPTEKVPDDNELKTSSVTDDVEHGSTSSHSKTHAAYRPLQRGLTARQVQMIAIAGTIGTGLFLGTGRSLAAGGPASLLICYSITGFIVYVTLLLLGEMGTEYPTAGSFSSYAGRFVSPSYGFALSWNYWFNDAVSVAGDLVAAQLAIGYWSDWHPEVIAVLFWLFLVGLNSVHVKVYGEMEYWFASLKVATIIVFIIVGILVNVGVNSSKSYIGSRNWRLDDAPFVNGFPGFLRVFVTASFAYGGTESLGITAGETKNPSKNMPRVVKFVFWRILIFYILSVFLIGLNIPYNTPGLANRSAITSPFTLVFREVGSNVAASFMNTVVLTSVLSAGNHALFAGTRVLYGLTQNSPPQAPRIFAWTTPNGIPLPALLATSSISVLAFGSKYIGNGDVFSWLQNLIGVSNQIAWFSIGLTSWRFRKAWVRQGRSLHDLKFYSKWTSGWGSLFVVFSTAILILVQGWSSFSPVFAPVDFVSYYVQIPSMIVFFVAWLVASNIKNKQKKVHDFVDLDTVDLDRDTYTNTKEDEEDDDVRARRMSGKFKVFWKIIYLIA